MDNNDEAVVVPARYSRIDPWVISQDTDAEIAFLAAVFGAAETPGSRMVGPEGRIGHVEVELGDAVLLMFDAGPDWPATDLAFGERVARVRDPQGHLWWLHQRVEEVDPAELGQRFADPSALQAMAYVQDSLTAEMSGAGGHG